MKSRGLKPGQKAAAEDLPVFWRVTKKAIESVSIALSLLAFALPKVSVAIFMRELVSMLTS